MARPERKSACPPRPLAVELTEQFYAWEARGRGWLLWDESVDLEPPFAPFHYRYPQWASGDDGQRPTWLSRLADWLCGRTPPAPHATTPSTAAESGAEAGPSPAPVAQPWVELQLAPPADFAGVKLAAQHCLLDCGYHSQSLAFELVGTAEAVVAQWAVPEADASHLSGQLKAHFPEVQLDSRQDYLKGQWEHSRGAPFIVDFGLSQEFVRPLRTFRSLEVDPLVGVLGVLDQLAAGEIGLLQVLFQPVRQAWAQSIWRSVTDWSGEDFFLDAPEMKSLAREKIAHPLYAAVLRVAARGENSTRAHRIAQSLGSALAPFSEPTSNELLPLTNHGYRRAAHEAALLGRQSQRSGMLLNAEELVGFVHVPSASVRSLKFRRTSRKSRVAPAIASGHALVLGDNVHQGQSRLVSLSPEQRSRHLYVVGASGTGKSNFLLELIRQDMENGEGLAVLDPHGDLVDRVLEYVPERRVQEVVFFDPADEEYAMGINLLLAHSELEKTLLGSDLVAVFERLATSWGDQMTTVLGNAIAAVLESTRGGTLHDLRRFLAEKDFRAEFLHSVTDSSLVYYWEKEFPLLSGRPQAAILTRLDTFLRSRLMRRILAQPDNRLDFAAIMNRGQLFLARLAQGAIGEENAQLLGSLLVAKLHQATLSRQALPESERRPFYLYLDEFHHFATPSMSAILAGVRKYRLGLVLAHQGLRQLEKRDPEVAAAALTNPYTRLCFRVGESDARKLAEGLGHFEAADMLNLGTGEVIGRIERAEFDFNLCTFPVAPVDGALARARKAQIIAYSRHHYATPAQEADAAFSLDAPTRPRPPATEAAPERPEALPPEAAPIGRPKVAQAVHRRQPVPAPPEDQSLLGKGGREHRYLQNLIKRWAEGMGYRATIEKPLANGGSVDVALEREGLSIACEITVSTSPEHEVENIRKCLDAGFERVAALSNEGKKLARLKALCRLTFSEEELGRVELCEPSDFFNHIEELDAQASAREDTVRGYRVKVQYRNVAKSEQASRRSAVSRVVAQALKRLNGARDK